MKSKYDLGINQTASTGDCDFPYKIKFTLRTRFQTLPENLFCSKNQYLSFTTDPMDPLYLVLVSLSTTLRET